DDRSHDGRVGGAAQAAEPDDRLAIGDALQAQVPAQLRCDRQLAGRSHAALDAIRQAMAEVLDGRDVLLGKGRQAALTGVERFTGLVGWAKTRPRSLDTAQPQTRLCPRVKRCHGMSFVWRVGKIARALVPYCEDTAGDFARPTPSPPRTRRARTG